MTSMREMPSTWKREHSSSTSNVSQVEGMTVSMAGFVRKPRARSNLSPPPTSSHTVFVCAAIDVMVYGTWRILFRALLGDANREPWWWQGCCRGHASCCTSPQVLSLQRQDRDVHGTSRYAQISLIITFELTAAFVWITTRHVKATRRVEVKAAHPRRRASMEGSPADSAAVLALRETFGDRT